MILAADWVTISALATAAGTLVLALATFASVRSANRAARVAELSLLAGLRPLLVPSRLDDPPQKVTFVEGVYLVAPGGAAVAEAHDDAVLLAAALRNVGSGIAVLHGWHFYPELVTATEHLETDAFTRFTRDIFIAPGEVGFWQGTFREPSSTAFAEARRTIEAHRLLDDRGPLRRCRGRPAHDQPLRDAGARRRLARLRRAPLVRRPRRPALADPERKRVADGDQLSPVVGA